MPITVVRYRAKIDRADENQALVEAVFEELHRRQPARLRYTVLRLADETFVHIVESDEIDRSGLTGLDAFGRFAAEIDNRVTEPPILESAVLVGTYGHQRLA